MESQMGVPDLSATGTLFINQTKKRLVCERPKPLGSKVDITPQEI